MTRLELDRFNDLQRQGFMQTSKPKKLSVAERRAKEAYQAELNAQQRAAFDAATAKMLED